MGIRSAATLLAALLGIPGCMRHEVKFDESQFTEAIRKVDRVIAAVDHAVAEITRESASWRKALGELEAKLKEDSQDLLANEVRNTTQAFARDLDDFVKVSADYLEAKLKDNLKAFRSALDRARASILAARQKKNASGIQQAFNELARVKVFADPVVTAFIPAHVELRWADAKQTGCQVRAPLVEVRGWGFERPGEEAPRFSVSIADASGKERPLPSTCVFITTRYLMQVKLDSPGVRFARSDHALVLHLGPGPAAKRSLPIMHVVPKEPPGTPPTPAPETVTGVVITIQTTGDNKEERGQVHLTLLDDLSALVHQHGPLGAGVNWEKGHTRTPYRSGVPDPKVPAAAPPFVSQAYWDELRDESRPVQAARLSRPIPAVEGRRVRLGVELQTTQQGRQVSWVASFRVRLYTSKKRVFEFQSGTHEFDTVDDRRFFQFDFTLPRAGS